MKTATLKQGRKILEMLEETPAKHLQMLIEGGYISDLLKANVIEMNRDDFRKACGLILDYQRIWKTITLGKTEIDLVQVTVLELGFENRARRRSIYKRALEMGLKLCPSQVGDLLCQKYKGESLNQPISIGMKPIESASGLLKVFSISRHSYGDWWLSSDFDRPEDVWSSADRWVFVRPRRK